MRMSALSTHASYYRGMVPHATKGVLDLNLSNGLVGNGLDFFEKLALLRNAVGICGLEVGFASSIGAHSCGRSYATG